MKKYKAGKFFSVFLVIFLISSGFTGNVFAEKKSLPTGLLELSGFKYPVYLYVPLDYKVGRSYPLVIMAPSESESGRESMDYLSGLVKRKSFFVLTADGFPLRDVTYKRDAWLHQIKKEVMERYGVNEKKIFLIGKGPGAHYAAYLGMQYPEEYSAVALLGGAWSGKLEEVIELKSRTVQQVPFLVMFTKAQQDVQAKNQIWFEKLQENGYSVEATLVEEEKTFSKMQFRKDLLRKLEEKSESWYLVRQESGKTFKEKFRKAVKDFFKV